MFEFQMTRVYFFDRKEVSFGNYSVDANARINPKEYKDVEVKVASGRKPLEAVSQLFELKFHQIVSFIIIYI